VLPTFQTLPQLFAAFPTEQSAVDYFTAIRWAAGQFCPLCGCMDEAKIGRLSKGGVPTNQYKCYDCRQKFSIRVGTIFQDTKLPLRTWFAAIWMITNHPKGIASTTLATDLGITQKSAWFVLHRLRHAARTDSFNRQLSGEVAADETYLGGKDRNRHLKDRGGRQGPKGKTMVMGIVEKDGEVRAGVLESSAGYMLQDVIREHVEPGAVVVTDEHYGYRGLAKDYDHRTVKHRAGQYVAKDGSTTNAVESLWSLFKRQYHGTHHWISPKHLDAYLCEMTFRQNRRGVDRGQRVTDLLAGTEGPLPYKVLIA